MAFTLLARRWSRDENIRRSPPGHVFISPLNCLSFHVGRAGVLKNIRYADPPIQDVQHGVEGRLASISIGGFALRLDAALLFPERKLSPFVRRSLHFLPTKSAHFRRCGTTAARFRLRLRRWWYISSPGPAQLSLVCSLNGHGSMKMPDVPVRTADGLGSAAVVFSF